MEILHHPKLSSNQQWQDPPQRRHQHQVIWSSHVHPLHWAPPNSLPLWYSMRRNTAARTKGPLLYSHWEFCADIVQKWFLALTIRYEMSVRSGNISSEHFWHFYLPSLLFCLLLNNIINYWFSREISISLFIKIFSLQSMNFYSITLSSAKLNYSLIDINEKTEIFSWTLRRQFSDKQTKEKSICCKAQVFPLKFWPSQSQCNNFWRALPFKFSFIGRP